MSNINLKVVMNRELFYNEKDMWGIFSFDLAVEDERVELNSYGNFVVKGNTPKLVRGKEYQIEVVPSFSKKYGDGWEFVNVKMQKPKSKEAQYEYFESQLTDRQYNSFIKAYPDHYLLDMLENDEIDHNLLHGIGEKTLINLKEKLLGDLEINQIVNKLKDLDVTPVAVRALLKHFLSAQAIFDMIEQNIYGLCVVKGFGFLKVDKYALNRGDSPENPARIEAAIRYVLEKDLEDGNTWLPIGTMRDRVGKITNTPPFIVTPIINEIRDNELHEIEISSKRAFFKSKEQREKDIANLIKSRVNSKPSNKLSDKEIDDNIKFQEELNNITYSSGQRNAIKGAIKNNIFVINGLAGSGKTASLKGVLNILNNDNYVSSALSGAAARVLASEGLHAKTIHLTLGINNVTGGFMHNKENLLGYDVVIIDEMSMPNMNILYSIFQAVKSDAKLILVGDMGQLPSVGEGAVFADLLEAGIVPSQELTEIHRQAQDSGIIEAANLVRNGNYLTDEYDYDSKTFGKLQDFSVIPTRDEENIGNIVLDIANRLRDTCLLDFQILSPIRERGEISVRNLNIGLQELYNDTVKPHVSSMGYDYREGDKVIHNGNNYEALTDKGGNTVVYNGTIGIIQKINFDHGKDKNHELVVKFVGIEDNIIIENDNLSDIEMAYAITVHKSQGASIKKVLFVFDFTSYMLLSRELVYTGITRASEACILVANNRALRKAIQTNASNTRKTFLGEFLEE